MTPEFKIQVNDNDFIFENIYIFNENNESFNVDFSPQNYNGYTINFTAISLISDLDIKIKTNNFDSVIPANYLYNQNLQKFSYINITGNKGTKAIVQFFTDKFLIDNEFNQYLQYVNNNETGIIETYQTSIKADGNGNYVYDSASDLIFPVQQNIDQPILIRKVNAARDNEFFKLVNNTKCYVFNTNTNANEIVNTEMYYGLNPDSCNIPIKTRNNHFGKTLYIPNDYRYMNIFGSFGGSYYLNQIPFQTPTNYGLDLNRRLILSGDIYIKLKPPILPSYYTYYPTTLVGLINNFTVRIK